MFGRTIAIVENDLAEVALATENGFVSSETAFIELLKAGDAAAFDELVGRFSGEIYGLLLRLTENAEEAGDLTQETFLRVVQSVKGFRGDASLKTWVFRIAINQARNRQRWWTARKQNETVSLDEEKFSNNGETFSLGDSLQDVAQQSPEDAVLQREQSKALRAALQQIPVQFREAVILRDIQGLNYDEIAEALQTNVGTVKSRIARGRDELRKKLRRSL